TAFVIVAAELYAPKVRTSIRDIRWVDALIIGCFQALAILPGISRSGVTIVGGLLRKFTRESAARLSFLMAIPVMLGASLVAGIELLTNHLLWQYWPAILAGFLTALLVGIVSIHWLLRYLQNHSLRPFAWYCVLVGLIGTLIGCSPAPDPIATKEPVYTVGVTSTTSELVRNLLMKSPYSEDFQIQIYSSDRQLIKAVSSGGVESGVVLYFPDNLSLFSVPLVLTKLHAIVQQDCDINELSIEDLRSVYTGTTVDWAEFGGVSEPIKLAVREEGDSARTIFESIVLDNTPPSPVARVFAGDDLMVEYVSNTNGAIGYGWQSSVSSDVKSLKISEAGNFSIPVYAISYKEFSGVLREWLAWVQQRPKTDLPEGFTPIR
ncbi:MAG TPA: undecaprenyl-diphosphate phosphatase, partial [Anaerolineales bacterium]|nr:undecaprenyl-diphosphate phosphatase [Anaerolineales bacterium]